MNAIVILSDGTTWTTMDGCSICMVTDEQLVDLNYGLCPSNLHNLTCEIRLTDCTPPKEIETIHRVVEEDEGKDHFKEDWRSN